MALVAESIGAIVRARREHLGFARRHIAFVTGLPERTVQNVESGRDCRVSTLALVLDALGLELLVHTVPGKE